VNRDRDDHGADTILIVEDEDEGEDALREVTRRILARSGYQVLTAAGGAEAIDLAGRHDGEIHPPREAVSRRRRCSTRSRRYSTGRERVFRSPRLDWNGKRPRRSAGPLRERCAAVLVS